MGEQRENLARWVTPEVPEQRLQRMWSAIDEADRGRGVPRWAIAAVALGVGAAAALAAVVVFRPSGALRPGAELASAAEPTVAKLADGSVAELGPRSALTLAVQQEDRVEIELRGGSATFDVVKRPTRKFVVRAHDVQVRVVGTRFTVRELDGAVQVSVERGAVEVTRGGQVTMLAPGQEWRSTPEVEEAPDDEPIAAAPSGSPAKRVKRTRPHKAAPPPAVVPEPEPIGAPEDPFREALAARREGRSAEAAERFEKFIRELPRDTRAPVAAFELGRIRMDALGDARGAVEALKLSLRLDARATYREEALSRLVRGYDELRDGPGCEQARAQYLAEFPEGAYAQGVRARCAGR